MFYIAKDIEYFSEGIQYSIFNTQFSISNIRCSIDITRSRHPLIDKINDKSRNHSFGLKTS